jgi:hypothetical protein
MTDWTKRHPTFNQPTRQNSVPKNSEFQSQEHINDKTGAGIGTALAIVFIVAFVAYIFISIRQYFLGTSL